MWHLEDEPDVGEILNALKSGRASREFYLIAESERDIIEFIEDSMRVQERKAVVISPDELGNHVLRETQYELYFLNNDYYSFEVLRAILGEIELARGIPPPQVQLYSSKSIVGYDHNLDVKVKQLQGEGFENLFCFPQFRNKKNI